MGHFERSGLDLRRARELRLQRGVIGFTEVQTRVGCAITSETGRL